MAKPSYSSKDTSAYNHARAIDWLIPIGLALLVVVTRLPFRTTMLYNWDSANFALGLRNFDVTVHAPHPPGYFFYVAVANLINTVVGEANASFVLLSIALSAGAVITTYSLGKAIFGRFAGLAASLLLTFSVTFWTYGELALAYPSLAFFSSLVALFAWRSLSGRPPSPGFAVLLSATYVVGSGFRPDLLLFLGPLWLWSLWLQKWRIRLLCVAIALAGFLLWYVPTALLSGGFAQYHAVLTAYTQTDVAARYSSTHKGLTGLIVNMRDTASYAFYAMYAAALPLAAGGIWLVTQRRLWLSRKAAFFLIWLTPMLLFYTIIHVGDPGYVFTFVPALVLLLGAFLRALPAVRPGWQRPLGIAVVAAVIVANTGVFLLHPRPMTAQGIKQNDVAYGEKIAFIRAQADPSSAILLSYDSFKHLLYYLPEYRQSIWVDVFSDAEGHLRIPSGVKFIILVDGRLNAINRSQVTTEEIILPMGTKAYVIPVRDGQVLTVGGSAIAVHD